MITQSKYIKKGGIAVRNFVYKPIDFLAIFILFYKDFMFDFNNLFNKPITIIKNQTSIFAY